MVLPSKVGMRFCAKPLYRIKTIICIYNNHILKFQKPILTSYLPKLNLKIFPPKVLYLQKLGKGGSLNFYQIPHWSFFSKIKYLQNIAPNLDWITKIKLHLGCYLGMCLLKDLYIYTLPPLLLGWVFVKELRYIPMLGGY
jgi:hypothetical protein